MSLCIGLENYIEIELENYLISIFQDGDHRVANLFPVSFKKVEIY